jgi:hypothetical protein
LQDDSGAQRLGYLCRTIRAAVDDDDFGVRNGSANVTNDFSDSTLFISRDHRYCDLAAHVAHPIIALNPLWNIKSRIGRLCY